MLSYTYWDKQTDLIGPLGTVKAVDYFSKRPSMASCDIVIGKSGNVVKYMGEVGDMLQEYAKYGDAILPTDSKEIVLQKLINKIALFEQEQQNISIAEAQAKVDAQNDQYLRDCNAELATVTAMPDVTPVDEPVVEDTRFKNYKWNYDNGYWNKTAMRLTVQKGMISKQEYQAITGEVYQ
jgi:hypothetical protein